MFKRPVGEHKKEEESVERPLAAGILLQGIQGPSTLSGNSDLNYRRVLCIC